MEFSEKCDYRNKAGMVALLLNLELYPDSSERMDFYAYLTEHNSVSDKDTWLDVQEELQK